MINQKKISFPILDENLILTDFIAKGATRECYIHPKNKDKCIKILVNNKDIKILERELYYYYIIKEILGDFVVKYEEELVTTNKGMGIVCELLRNDDGKISKPIKDYMHNGKIESDIEYEMDFFVYQLLVNKLYFYDFNLNNFVIQIKKGEKKLKYIDLKSYENNKSLTFLKLEKFISPLAEKIMIRRLKRLYEELGINWKGQ